MARPPQPPRAEDPVRGTVLLHSVGHAVTMPPREERVVTFGRNRPEVNLCMGEDDLRVSRTHGVLTFRSGRWWLHTTGTLAIRMGESLLLHADDEPVPLPEGYTSLVVEGSGGRLHLVEVLVVGPDGGRVPRHGAKTAPVRAWQLHPEERLAVVAIAQEYLHNNPGAQPLSWARAAELLAELQPGRGWTWKVVEHRVRTLRLRLSACGVYGLIRSEAGGSGDVLKHNLIKELLSTNTIGRRDLDLLDPPSGYRTGCSTKS